MFDSVGGGSHHTFCAQECMSSNFGSPCVVSATSVRDPNARRIRAVCAFIHRLSAKLMGWKGYFVP
jgi:hypothetical protein